MGNAWGHSVRVDWVFEIKRALGYRDDCRITITEWGVLTFPRARILEIMQYVKKNIHKYRTYGDFHN